MKYNVYIQDNFNSSIEASNTGDALRIIGLKINNQEIVFDESKSKSVRIEISDD
jgi:hypothetical protein